MDDQTIDVRKHHSFHVNKSSVISNSSEQCQSYQNISKKSSSLNDYYMNIRKDYILDECKNYSHDEIKNDDSSFNDHSFNDDRDSGRYDMNDSITNSNLDEIEKRILTKISQELQTDDSSSNSLDSNVKLFKTTVNHILENFYTNVQEFEVYKKRFNEILEKNRGDSVGEMEDFIKDMVQHIGTSDSSLSDGKNLTGVKAFNDKPDNYRTDIDSNEERISNSLNSTIEAFKNENYLTDSTFEQNSSKFYTSGNKDKSLNIFLFNDPRCVELRMNDRSIFSEINIRDQCCDSIKEPLASAENIKKLEAKKIELENYVKRQEPDIINDIEIPVKISNAKKNIHTNENFLDNDKDDTPTFFIFRICNYICRKIRKNAIG